MDNQLLTAALQYRELGWSVIPLSPGTKIPPKGFDVIKRRSELAQKEEIEGWWKENPKYNIGIITGKLSNLFVIDLDKYKPEYSEETVLKYIPDNIETPIDKSPRGGEHLYFNYPTDSDPTIHADTLPAVDYRGENGYILAPPSIFEGKAASWIFAPTGKPISDAPAAFINLLKSINNKESTNYIHTADDNNTAHCRQVSSLSSSVFVSGRRDQDLFHLANLLVKGGCEHDFLNEVMNIAAMSCNPPFPVNEVKTKIDSAIQRAERKERNLTQEISEWVLSSSGQFLSSDVSKCLHLSSRDDQKHLSTVLKRLGIGEKRIIEKVGNKNGCWRTIDKDEEMIDYKNVDLTPYAIRFPLKVEDYVTIHKGNIIVLAGESNAGKTAFLMNVALNNSKEFDVNYMSSEMQNGAELRIRMDEFEVPIDRWDRIKFQFRTDNFPDKINPDGLNIIDYLDEGSDAEAYRMGGRLREIADKLKSGVAVVSIQKDSQKIYGFGGSGTLNRARLYMTISTSNVLTIIKGKIWRNKNCNPNGMHTAFTLAGGCKFREALGGWTQ